MRRPVRNIARSLNQLPGRPRDAQARHGHLRRAIQLVPGTRSSRTDCPDAGGSPWLRTPYAVPHILHGRTCCTEGLAWMRAGATGPMAHSKKEMRMRRVLSLAAFAF